VDASRNLVYLRGQVPGPVGRSVFLRDSRLAPAALRASWGLPFPTHVPTPEEVKSAPAPGDVSASDLAVAPGAQVWRNPTDPYLMYREETDYVPIKWKKGE
jgi:large subunit ribosomal protein L3